MSSRHRHNPAEFERCVSILTRKIEDLAIKAGVPDSAWHDLQSTLAALPRFYRDRASLMLQGIAVHADEALPTMAFAAKYVLNLAREIWETAPAPERSVFAGLGAGNGSTPS